ncbi:M23 family metallopeptidase [Vitiosangium sp. GDMCC 1.1324]|uniref:M23 family metallopeptidase n=1 Tax=Vitiosangium sp. (strain GDMCC 1.1324) TaxID=2138576 RepID=UPI000D3D006B|nr:M23 family metallopeptidase [Vitiosangium sp. GDMCC 1.1324]PTL77900.1 peptidase M23 [Vitiosangium sp. GDMCC 1.1324]
MFPRHVRGLLDFSLAVLCLWTAWHHTPVGALVRRSAAWALGSRSTARPLLAYYDGVSGTGVSAPTLAPVAPPLRPFSDMEALAYGTHLALKGLSPSARAPAFALAGELGIPPESLLDETRGPVAARRLHEALNGAFPLEESRLTAVFAGRVPARYALERVAAEGGTPDLERLARQLPPGFEDATVAAAQALALATAFGLAWPVPEHTPVTSPFGYRTHPVLGTRKLHTGVDLSVREGSEVHVVADGTVRRASEDGVNGRVLIVDHGRGVTTAYCHNSELLVRPGQRVARGELIARSGNTGRSTGPHLHYQLELSAQPVDPLRFRPRTSPVADETAR